MARGGVVPFEVSRTRAGGGRLEEIAEGCFRRVPAVADLVAAELAGAEKPNTSAAADGQAVGGVCGADQRFDLCGCCVAHVRKLRTKASAMQAV